MTFVYITIYPISNLQVKIIYIKYATIKIEYTENKFKIISVNCDTEIMSN